MAFTIQRLPAVLAKTGQSRSTLYNHIGQGLFVAPVKLSERCAGWPAHEVEAINAARIAGKSPDEIRKLVEKLHADRLSAV